MTKQMMVLIALFAYVLIRSIFIEPNALEITKYQAVDKQLNGIRVAFLTDFHLKKRDYKRLDKIVQKTNSQNPNLILLGGDFANGHSGSNTMNPSIIAQKLNLLTAPTYSVLGNHDWWTDGNGISKALEDNGIKVLENESVRIIVKNRYIDIIGLADLTTKNVDIANSFIRTNTPRLVISHNPDVYYDIINRVNMIFAGHTHGGQFILPFMRPLFVPSKYGAKFASGLITPEKNQMIISKGLGTSVLPLRLNCKPEIIIVDFVAN